MGIDTPSQSENRSAFRFGECHGNRAREAIRHNVAGFWQAVTNRGIDRDTVLEQADRRQESLLHATRVEFAGIASSAGLSYEDILCFNLFEEAFLADGCSVAIAAGDAGENGTVFFKQSDKKGADEFVGEHYHEHQQINVLRIEDHDDGTNRIVTVTPAGATTVKMGINEHGVAIGANLSRTVTFDEDASNDPNEWAAGSRGEYMRQGILHGDTAVEVAQHIAPKLFSDPMSSPGNIDIADGSKAIILEGEFTHLSSEWVEDDVVARANKFEVLTDLARSADEIPSSYSRHGRMTEVLEENEGEITAALMRELSTDHTNGPGLESICRHEENGYTDETSLSSSIFDIDPENPADSDLYIALGKPCHSWRSAEGDGWIRISPDTPEDEIPDRFFSGDAWLDHYTEEPNHERELPPIS